MSYPALLTTILKELDELKGENIKSIDVRNKTILTDFMVIVSGRSSRQVSSMAQLLIEKMKKHQHNTISIAGLEQGEWALVDFGDVIVNIFQPDARAYYDIEGLWS